MTNLLKTNPNILNNPEEPKPRKPIRKLYKVRSGLRPRSPETMRDMSLARNAAIRLEAPTLQPSTYPEKKPPLPSRKNSCLRKRQLKNPQARRPTKAEAAAGTWF